MRASEVKVGMHIWNNHRWMEVTSIVPMGASAVMLKGNGGMLRVPAATRVEVLG